MRNNLSLFISAAIVLAAGSAVSGCSRSECASGAGMVPLTVTASLETGVPARTSVSSEDATKVLWMPEDEIVLFTGGHSARFTSTNKEGPVERAEFTGMIPAVVGGGEGSSGDPYPFRAIYPYDASATCVDGVYTTTLPSSQVAEAGTFADDLFITIARSTSTDLAFYNVCSGLKFTVDRDDISSMEFIANGGEVIAGSFSAVFGEDGFPAVQSVAEGTPEIVFKPVEGCFQAGKNYYLVTLPGTLTHGFTMHLHCSDGDQGSFRYSKSVTFNRAKFRTVSLSSEGNTFYIQGDDLDIVPAQVRSYLNSASASYPSDCGPDGYTRTVMGSNVTQFNTGDPVKVAFSGNASGIVVSTDPLYGDAVRRKSVSSSPVSLYNLIPGKRYFYKLLSGSSVAREGCFTPVGPLRMIRAGNPGSGKYVKNVRDLGGWEAEGGRHVAYGKLYRGAKMDDNWRAAVDSLGLQADLDLRGRTSSVTQSINDTPTNPAGFAVENAQSYYAPVRQPSQNENSYINIQTQQLMYENRQFGVTAGLYQVAIRYVIEKLSEDKVVYFHCYGGADRTGTLAFLIEALLGVSESDLSQDYELTSYGGNSRFRTGLPYNQEFAFNRFVTDYLYSSRFPGDDIQEVVTAWATTQDPSMPEVNPLTTEEIARLKALLLE